MSINSKILSLSRRLCNELEVPEIVGLYLPGLSADEKYRDEFGFVFLADGTAAPFYVSLPGVLASLHQRFPDPGRTRLGLWGCLQGFAEPPLAERALALGAWNALSQYLMRQADFQCPPRGAAVGFNPQPGERVGMVGYFCPVIDRLVEQGMEVLVIEQQPGRVPQREHVELSENIEALEECRLVYCTASTLINDSLERVLDCCTGAESVDLIGPSGSGLPDVVFEYGIHAVGGVSFGDVGKLHEALRRRESWGVAGSKYELTSANYPGFEKLLATARNKRSV
ncbi:MAG: hypothetical protein GY784_07570 [Gammaproteobacteria bacterium]|nr:hypothetical protein [Gammaproteobacteria bacterium]